MDERQAQIREGAGLEESKLNVEFIDWLRKWSTPLLMVIALAALGYVIYQRWERAKLAEVDRAFAELNGALASANPNPESLKGIAQTYEHVRAVPLLARLSAADLYLGTARTGVKPGAPVKQDGSVAPEDLLTEDERGRNLDEAEHLYRAVLDRTATPGGQAHPGQALHALSAAYGLAAVAESRGDLDKARSYYEQVKKIADFAGLLEQVKVAQKRIDELPSLKEKPRLYAAAELPKPPPPPAPPAPIGPTGVTGASGATAGAAATGEVGSTGASGAAPMTGAVEPGATGRTGPSGSPPPAPSGAAPATGSPAPSGAPAATSPAATPPATPK